MKFNNVKIAFFGSSRLSVIVLEKLQKLGIIPNIIVTVPDKPKGRKLILTPNEVKVWAENNSMEYITPAKLKEQDVLDKLATYDLFIVASYGKIIPKVVIDLPKFHVLNVHPSLLPKYRGPSPLQEQILNDEKNIGVTIIEIDEDVDHGPIIAQKNVVMKNWPIGYRELETILAEIGAEMLGEILPDWIEGKISPKIQNHEEATFTKKFEKEDGLLDISQQDRDVNYKNYLKYLAFENWPGTYFMQKDISGQDKRIKIKFASWTNDTFRIEKVIPEGKNEMKYEDYLRGIKSNIN